MHVRVYTRHHPDCIHAKKRYWAKCNCPKWLAITSDDAPRKLLSAKTRSWERAEKKAKEILDVDTLPTAPISLVQAVADYLADKQQQNISAEWMERLELTLRKRLLPWCEKEKLEFLRDLDLEALRSFRKTWVTAALTRSKTQDRLRSFLKFCQDSGWIKENPAARLSRIKVDSVPTDYFKPEQFDKILAAVDSYHAKGRPETRDRARQRARAMILLLRWSGLRLGDASRLERSRLDHDGRLFLHMAKTGEPVFVPLPPKVAKELRAVPNLNPAYFFWTGNGDKKTVVDDWWRTLSRVFKHADLGKRAHPHMFRDTFAIELLLAGVPIEQVSQLLGHSSIKITEKHYAPWVKARQKQLEQSVRKAWAGQ
jgi:integrase/recombinase XerD